MYRFVERHSIWIVPVVVIAVCLLTKALERTGWFGSETKRTEPPTEYVDPQTHPQLRPLTEEEFRKLQEDLKRHNVSPVPTATPDRDAMLRNIDADFRKYMASNYPELPAAPPGKQWQPHYDVWIGKNWRNYPGFWKGNWEKP